MNLNPFFYSFFNSCACVVCGGGELAVYIYIYIYDLIYCVQRHFQQYFGYHMATSFSDGRSRREPPTMGKQLVNFISLAAASRVHPFCNL
jgi:hypothetical protein